MDNREYAQRMRLVEQNVKVTARRADDQPQGLRPKTLSKNTSPSAAVNLLAKTFEAAAFLERRWLRVRNDVLRIKIEMVTPNCFERFKLATA
jgi:hypothetical protein